MSVPSADIIREILGKLLILPNDTRWNAFFDALEALLAAKANLNDIMDALGFRRFTVPEITFLEEYLCLTKPLAMCLDILQGDSASLGMVLPTITKLKQFWEKKISEGSLTSCAVMAKFLLWDLNERTSELFDDKDYILGKLVGYYYFMYLQYYSRYIIF